METIKPGYLFLQDVIQGGRKKPKKFRHYIKIPSFLFDECITKGIINTEDLYTSEAAYFEFSECFVTISFITYWNVEDVHIRILDYIVRRELGYSPIMRGGHAF